MAKKFPNHHRFLLCEDAREETGNKFTLLGLYTADNIILPKGETVGKSFPALAIVLILKGGEGSFSHKAELRGPDNEIIFEKVDPIDIPPETAMTLVYKWIGFHVKKYGRFEFLVTLDGDDQRAFKYSFEIRSHD